MMAAQLKGTPSSQRCKQIWMRARRSPLGRRWRTRTLSLSRDLHESAAREDLGSGQRQHTDSQHCVLSCHDDAQVTEACTYLDDWCCMRHVIYCTVIPSYCTAAGADGAELDLELSSELRVAREAPPRRLRGGTRVAGCRADRIKGSFQKKLGGAERLTLDFLPLGMLTLPLALAVIEREPSLRPSKMSVEQ